MTDEPEIKLPPWDEWPEDIRKSFTEEMVRQWPGTRMKVRLLLDMTREEREQMSRDLVENG